MFDGHQGEGVLDWEHEAMSAEFVGPGSKLYCNYHLGLNTQKCDVCGQFLPDDAPLLQHAEKAQDDWTPYRNWLEFELANFLFTHVEMLAKKLILGGQPPFTNHADLYSVIDSTHIGNIRWGNFTTQYTCKQHGNDPAPWMSDNYEVWYQDPCKVIHSILSSPRFIGELDYVPYHEYGTSNDQRCWQDFMSGDWAQEQADRVLGNDPTAARVMLVPIILGSDKMTISVATGQMDYYPLYLSTGNVHNTALCTPQCNATREHARTPAFHKFQSQLFHSSLIHILHSLHHPMKVPETILFGDNYYPCVIYSLAVYIANYEEQALLSCIVCNWCPKYALRHTQEHCNTVTEEFELHKLWDTYEIVSDIVLIKGGFKDHLVDWVERYLIHIHGKTEVEKILDDIDRWYWTGNDSKGLMKVYVTAIERHVPRDVVHTFQKMLTELDDALGCFHHFHKVFRNARIIKSFSLPWQHAMKHYHHLICQFGVPNGLCSSITESKHIKAVKWPYWRTNWFQALGQIILINQRLDKLTAVCVDFKEHGMLNGTCLSKAFEVLVGISEEGWDAVEESEEQTASYVEGPGDTLDDPMAINAHVSLAHKHHSTNYSVFEHTCTKNVGALAAELGVTEIPNILCHFLHSQLCPTDNHDPEDIPLQECPSFNGKICVCNSMCSTFFAPSQLNGTYGMHHEYICSCPMWRGGGPHLDYGMHHLDIAHILCFFSFKYLGKLFPCAIVHWFDHVRDGPDTATGMWIVCPSYHTHNHWNITIIHINTVQKRGETKKRNVQYHQSLQDPTSL
ncbi:hypothetical protein F5141DRAFT_1187848 [Pisolithus sp. B1]|nr:hypothetical protein F5141DRAFT_1187848 [Pisolithus sp. B1]